MTTLTTENFEITRYNLNGNIVTINYKKGAIVNVNGNTNTGLGPNKNNSYQLNPKYSYVDKFFVVKPYRNIIVLPEVIVTP